MIITAFSVILISICAFIGFKLGFLCGQTYERLELLKRFGEKADMPLDSFGDDLQKIMNYTGVSSHE